MYLTRRISFEAAHQLQSPGWKHSKCANVHGHTWHVEVTIRGEIDPSISAVIDFSQIGTLLKSRVFERLDHTFINDVLGVQDATSEILAVWIWNQLWSDLRTDYHRLHEVKVQETESCWAVYIGD